jgi:peptide/nickel transport system permease protein
MVAAVADPELAGGARGARRLLAWRPAAGAGALHWWAPGLLVAVTLGLALAPLLLGAGEREVVGEPFTSPLDGHLLGTDAQGRDMLARLVLGLRTSWLAALAVIGIGVVVGAAVGLLAGFAGGWVDAVLMRVTDAALAVPGPLVALAVAAALGAGLRNTLLAVAATWWPWYARIVRGQVVALVARPHVEAARLGDLGRVRTAVVHVLPGTVGPVVVAASLDVGAVMLVLAGLSFLGLGSPPPAAELGAMTAQGMTYLFNAPWVAVVPAAGLFALAVLANLAGDGLRDLVAEHQ